MAARGGNSLTCRSHRYRYNDLEDFREGKKRKRRRRRRNRLRNSSVRMYANVNGDLKMKSSNLQIRFFSLPSPFQIPNHSFYHFRTFSTFSFDIGTIIFSSFFLLLFLSPTNFSFIYVPTVSFPFNVIGVVPFFDFILFSSSTTS